jgi:hypothetical protein
MAVRRPKPAPPFVTRRSTLTFSAVCLLATLALQALTGPSTSSASGLLVALLASLALVTCVVAWVAGVVLAVRAGSLLWTIVAALPVPPLNSAVCAVFCPSAPGERRG